MTYQTNQRGVRYSSTVDDYRNRKGKEESGYQECLIMRLRLIEKCNPTPSSDAVMYSMLKHQYWSYQNAIRLKETYISKTRIRLKHLMAACAMSADLKSYTGYRRASAATHTHLLVQRQRRWNEQIKNLLCPRCPFQDAYPNWPSNRALRVAQTDFQQMVPD
jgi:hypothetical protein